MRKTNIDCSSSLPQLIDVNWLCISCKVTRKKKSVVNKWATLTIGKITGKSMKSSITKSSKQDSGYLVLLKV